MYLMCKEQLDFSKTSFSQPGEKKHNTRSSLNPPQSKATPNLPRGIGVHNPRGSLRAAEESRLHPSTRNARFSLSQMGRKVG